MDNIGEILKILREAITYGPPVTKFAVFYQT
jgi:hypothetical protein